MPSPKERPDDAKVEPLYSALEPDRPSAKGPALRWKLLWAALVLLGLVALVLKQAY